MLAIRLT